MTPVYFPFTHLCLRAAASLEAHFETLALLRPFADPLPSALQALVRRGFLKALAPCEGDEEGAAAAIRQLQEWAARHTGGVGPAAAFHLERSADEERSAFDLAARIRRRSGSQKDLSAADRLRAARVFLHLAQEFDRQNEEVLEGLFRHEGLTTRMMKELTGRYAPASGAPAEGPAVSGREVFCLAERIAAWGVLFRQTGRTSSILATTCAAVGRRLLEDFAGARCVPLAMVREPADSLTLGLVRWAAAPQERIEALPEAPAPESLGASGEEPQVLLFPDRAPERLRDLRSHPRRGGIVPRAEATPPRHTLLVIVSSATATHQDNGLE
jgi:hypothetical protein